MTVTDVSPPLPVIPPDPDWMLRAACRGSDTRVFFPEEKTNTGPARAVCAGCEVAEPCLEDALADEARVGVWGQTSARQRREIRFANKIIATPADGLSDRLDRFEHALTRFPGGGRLADEWKALRAELTGAQRVTPVAAAYMQPALVAPHQQARFLRKNPAPGLRICAKCEQTKPIGRFTVTDKATGKLHVWCKDCNCQYQRDRSIKVGQVAIDIELLHGDPMVGQPCPGCRRPFQPGEHVTADHVTHIGCQAQEVSA